MAWLEASLARARSASGSPLPVASWAPRCVEVEADAGQERAQAVVEVPAQPAALLFTRLDDALTRRHQIGRERLRVDGGTRLPGQVGQHRAVTRVQRRLPPPRRGDQGSDPRALGHERPPSELGVGRLQVAVLGQHGAVCGPLDRDVRQPERLRDRGDHGLQYLARGGDGIEPLAQVAQGLVGIASLAVEQLVDQVLAAAQRRPEDERRDHCRSHQPDPFSLECRDAGCQRREDPGDHDAHQQVRRGSADDGVDRPQPIAHDRDDQGGGEEQSVGQADREGQRLGDRDRERGRARARRRRPATGAGRARCRWPSRPGGRWRVRR